MTIPLTPNPNSGHAGSSSDKGANSDAPSFTPGPWHWTWNGPGSPGRVGKSIPGEPVEDCGWGSYCVALTYDQNGRFDQKANAMLIAAAPELLEALQQCASFIGGINGPNDWHVQIARAAIAKATGGSS